MGHIMKIYIVHACAYFGLELTSTFLFIHIDIRNGFDHVSDTCSLVLRSIGFLIHFRLIHAYCSFCRVLHSPLSNSFRT